MSPHSEERRATTPFGETGRDSEVERIYELQGFGRNRHSQRRRCSHSPERWRSPSVDSRICSLDGVSEADFASYASEGADSETAQLLMAYEEQWGSHLGIPGDFHTVDAMRMYWGLSGWSEKFNSALSLTSVEATEVWSVMTGEVSTERCRLTKWVHEEGCHEVTCCADSPGGGDCHIEVYS
jgi:hypothetical protein